MSRLTARGADGHAYFPECFNNPKCRGGGCGDYKCRFMDDVAERLARYEDAEDGSCMDDGGEIKVPDSSCRADWRDRMYRSFTERSAV